ncbi:MAG: hypothetical protein V1740_03520 [Candidatus Woesearchaeota archaeon]
MLKTPRIISGLIFSILFIGYTFYILGFNLVQLIIGLVLGVIVSLIYKFLLEKFPNFYLKYEGYMKNLAANLLLVFSLFLAVLIFFLSIIFFKYSGIYLLTYQAIPGLLIGLLLAGYINIKKDLI